MSPQATDNTEYLQIGLNSYERGPDAMSRPHRHNEIELVYLKSGSVVYLFGGTKVALKPKTLVAFWAGVPHQVVRFSSSTVLLGLEVPVAWFLQWKLPDFLTQSLLGGQLLTESDPAFQASDARALNRWNLDLHSGREELKRAVLLEVEARFWRFAEGNAAALRQSAQRQPAHQTRLVLGEGGLGRVEKLAQYIADNYTKSIKVEDVAKVIDLHPDYAMKIFHKAFGTRLADYLTQHRVFHAQRLLANTDAKIMDIALESGFGSLSRFNANFKEFCGRSPKEYRNEMKPKN
jgi:AraC-like DNA-binding protein